MKKIFCVGEALIDLICTDKGKPLAQGTNFLKKAGGAPANAAAAIAALGGQVDLAAKVGKDPFGDFLIQTIKQYGVSTKYVFQDPKHFTTLAFVSLMENGERDFYFSRGADGQLSMDDLTAVNFNDYSVMHFGAATGFMAGPSNVTYHKLLREAIQQNAIITFDPNYRSLLFQHDQANFIEQSWTFLEACHFFKVSDEEAFLLTGIHSLEAAASVFHERTKAVFCITLGEKGTWLGWNNTDRIIPSIPVKVEDTTGAGDAFIGAMIYQLTEQSPDTLRALPIETWERMVANANKAGARTCEYLGAMEAFPYLSNELFNS